MKRFFWLLFWPLLLVCTCCAHSGPQPHFPYDAPGAVLSLHGDLAFSPLDRQYIQEACDNWSKQTLEYVQVHVTYDLDFADEASVASHVEDDVIMAVDEDFEHEWQTQFERPDDILLGLTSREHYVFGFGHVGTRIWIVVPYLDSHRLFVSVVQHEMGHALGMNHVSDDSALMAAASGWNPPTCLHRSDVRELCRVYGCDPERIGYCAPD